MAGKILPYVMETEGAMFDIYREEIENTVSPRHENMDTHKCRK